MKYVGNDRALELLLLEVCDVLEYVGARSLCDRLHSYIISRWG